ncbi:MAG TPA: hybrid sensor histidine kinase/response regulator [Planctomycetaceae bacterium]|nr:hybrid sensor histidine kinase/response regulator [Planctomycetaceae bacterium]
MTTGETHSGAASGECLRGADRGRILIVDDRPDKLLMLEAALSSLGREIVQAGSGSEALRALLVHDFAVVLLDINMPGLDGFETARLIRLRRRNQHTPIIFITSYGDDMHAVEAYSLGAVDFILTPVVPAVLRSKVGVFLELYERTAQVREHAERLLQRTTQLQALTRASLAIHAAPSIERTLAIAADAAREIIDSRCACAIVTADHCGLRDHRVVVSPAGRGVLRLGPGAGVDLPAVTRDLTKRTRFQAVDEAVPDLVQLLPVGIPVPAGGAAAALTAPLAGRDGSTIGVLVAVEKREADFSDDDEALLLQLAQMTATAIENTLFAEAREANRIKDEFLATLSHELRTPLSSILGWAQLLRTHMLDEQETSEALEIIEHNAEMQCKLIEDLLDISRIVTGKMQLTMRPANLAGVIQAAVNVILPAAHAKQVQIDLALDDAAAHVHGDPDRLQQVVWNLLSNAVKFTPPSGRIEIHLEAGEGRARLAVHDNGEGISPEFLPHMFDRFRQADSSISRKHGGLGIGLGIVRHVVELHGGSVRAESEGAGRGTTIFVELPLAAGDGGDAEARRVPRGHRENGENGDRSDAERAGSAVGVTPAHSEVS